MPDLIRHPAVGRLGVWIPACAGMTDGYTASQFALTKGFTPERRARVETRKAELRAAMPLHELRQARATTQKALGEALHVKQPAVAKLERRADMYVSNLRAYIEALGGRLSIVAEFPQGSVTITNFSDVGDDTHDG